MESLSLIVQAAGLRFYPGAWFGWPCERAEALASLQSSIIAFTKERHLIVNRSRLLL